MMSRTSVEIGVVLVGWGMLLLGNPSPVYAHKRPLPPPVIVVKPVPRVEIYRNTPYWMSVPSWDFKYSVRYPPRARAYRGVYVSWPWPVYVPYGSPVPLPSLGGPQGPGAWDSGAFPSQSWPEGALPSPEQQSPFLRQEPTPAPGLPSPQPPSEESLPELIPPPMPVPAVPNPAPNPVPGPSLPQEAP